MSKNVNIYVMRRKNGSYDKGPFFLNGNNDTRESFDLIWKKYSSNNTSTFSEGWKVKTLEGLGPVEVEIFTENKGFGNGSFITGQRQQARHIEVEAVALSSSQNAEKRHEALSFFKSNSIYTYDICITYQGRTQWFENCIIEAFSLPSGNVYDQQTLKISLFNGDIQLSTVGNPVNGESNSLYRNMKYGWKRLFSVPYVEATSKEINMAFTFHNTSKFDTLNIIITDEDDNNTFTLSHDSLTLFINDSLEINMSENNVLSVNYTHAGETTPVTGCQTSGTLKFTEGHTYEIQVTAGWVNYSSSTAEFDSEIAYLYETEGI